MNCKIKTIVCIGKNYVLKYLKSARICIGSIYRGDSESKATLIRIIENLFNPFNPMIIKNPPADSWK